MRPFQVVAFVLFAFSFSIAQTAPAAAPKTQASQRFSIDNIDKTVDPCTDFYQYACGNWIKNTEIPADQSSWVSFNELDERNQYTMRDILDKAAVASQARDAITQKIGDFYSTCMDEKAADAKGSEPLKPELDRIAAVKDKTALIDTIAELHLRGTRGLFSFYSSPDLHNADMVVGNLDQGGLTLPDRNYYIKDDAKMVEMRQHLVDYATQLFTLAGRSPEQAADSAKTVLRIETALAKASMDRTLRRDPKNRDHKMAREQAVALAPNFYLSRYFTAVGTPAFTELNVVNPDFFKDVNGLLDTESLDALKVYVTWHLLDSAAPWLSKPWVDSRRGRWAAIAAKGKTRWVLLRGVLGFGILLTAFTFLGEHFNDQTRLGLRQISSDLLVRVPFCLMGGYIFGLLTWKWFSLRYGRFE
jgi:predicted metalloendopeptidase